MTAELKSAHIGASADAVSRYNIYGLIHKGLRGLLTDALLRWGRMDVSDDCERAESIARVRAMLAICAAHLRHENEFLHPVIEQARASAAARTGHEHLEHESAIAALSADLAQFETAPAALRSALAHRLYLQLSAFIAENLEHMIVEETQNHAALIAAKSEEEILEIEHRIVASQTPEESFTTLRWMLGHVNAEERAFLLRESMRDAPREVLEAALGLARDVLSQRDFFKLERALA